MLAIASNQSTVSAQTFVYFGVYDVNQDGVAAASDATTIINYLGGGGPSSPTHAGSSRLTYDVTSTLVDAGEISGPADNTISALDALHIINFIATPYNQNPVDQYDVNASGSVSALDALFVINRLSAGPALSYSDVSTPTPPPFNIYPLNFSG